MTEKARVNARIAADMVGESAGSTVVSAASEREFLRGEDVADASAVQGSLREGEWRLAGMCEARSSPHAGLRELRARSNVDFAFGPDCGAALAAARRRRGESLLPSFSVT